VIGRRTGWRWGVAALGLALVLGCAGWPTPLEQSCFLDDALCAELVQTGLDDPGALPDGETRESLLEMGRSRCMDGSAALCFVYAKHLDWSNASGRTTALEAMQRTCDADYEDACFQVARIHEEPGEGQDLSMAATLYEKGCEADGSASACNNLGYLVERGEGVEQDLSRATALYERACRGDDRMGCTNFGLMIVDTDPEKALTVWKDTCDDGHGNACREASVLVRSGRVGEPDVAGGALLAARGCELGSASACRMRATDLLEGNGVSADPAAGVALLESTCAMPDARACNHLGVLLDNARHGVAEDKERARTLFRTSCELGYGQACSNLALHVPEEEREPLLRRACEGNSGDGCNSLGLVAEKAGDAQAAVQLYLRACELNSMHGCANAGILQEREVGDAAAAKRYYERACALQHPKACRWAAEMR
jgi:TPR repeat protein